MCITVKTAVWVRPDLNATAEARVKGLVGLRECVQQLIDLQMDAATPDSAIQDKQAELNRLYDSFSAKYGLINDRANRLAFADDSSYYLLCALEVIDEDGKLERKADMFTKRTIKPHKAVDTVDTASEALAVSISGKSLCRYGVYGGVDRQDRRRTGRRAARRDLPCTWAVGERRHAPLCNSRRIPVRQCAAQAASGTAGRTAGPFLCSQCGGPYRCPAQRPGCVGD